MNKPCRLVLCIFLLTLPCSAQSPQISTTAPEDAGTYLSKVPRDHWAYVAVNKLARFNIIEQNKVPAAQQQITRLEFALSIAPYLLESPELRTPARVPRRLLNLNAQHHGTIQERAEAYDAVAALSNEFQTELVLLGVPLEVLSNFQNGPCYGLSKRNPLVFDLLTQLKTLFKEKNVPASTMFFGDSLVAEHQMQDFFIHAVDKTGKIDSAPHVQRGPNESGFALRISFIPGSRPRSTLKTDADGTVRELYWFVYSQRYRIGKTKEKEKPDSIQVKLLTGEHTNVELIRQIKQIINKTIKEYR